eukprot:s62_g5.t1
MGFRKGPSDDSTATFDGCVDISRTPGPGGAASVFCGLCLRPVRGHTSQAWLLEHLDQCAGPLDAISLTAMQLWPEEARRPSESLVCRTLQDVRLLMHNLHLHLRATSPAVPGPIEDDNKLHDKEAEAVIQYAEAEKQAQEEQHAMALEDPLLLVLGQAKEPAGADQVARLLEKWADELADRVEIQRLCSMRVLVSASEFQQELTGKLTTKFVRDWRLAVFGEGADERKRWMRRSHLVAREFATTKRLDTFSEPWVICKNLPGQRLGAKQWFQYLHAHLESTMNFEFSMEQPCMARAKECTILIHVDDILFVGLKSFWNGTFPPNMSQKFSVSHDELSGNGTSMKFLRRKITEVRDGLVLTPGTSVAKVVKVFEESFGLARQQKIPCSSELQPVDSSQKLDEKDASAFRSVVGLCLYVGRERPDLMFTIKELASVMAAPTVSSLQHLRKLIGFMKCVGDVGIKMYTPKAGMGKFQAGGNFSWVLESFSDADFELKQEPQEEQILKYPPAEWMFCLRFQQKPKGDILVKLRERVT